jgi:hypothetical protein
MTMSKYGIALMRTPEDYTDLRVHVCRRTPDNPHAPKLQQIRGNFLTVFSSHLRFDQHEESITSVLLHHFMQNLVLRV